MSHPPFKRKFNDNVMLVKDHTHSSLPGDSTRNWAASSTKGFTFAALQKRSGWPFEIIMKHMTELYTEMLSAPSILEKGDNFPKNNLEV